MRRLTVSAAVVTAFAALCISIPAQAENNGGGPVAKNGQCFTYSRGNPDDARFGYWGGCPQTASSTTTTTTSANRPRRPRTTASR